MEDEPERIALVETDGCLRAVLAVLAVSGRGSVERPAFARGLPPRAMQQSNDRIGVSEFGTEQIGRGTGREKKGKYIMRYVCVHKSYHR